MQLASLTQYWKSKLSSVRALRSATPFPSSSIEVSSEQRQKFKLSWVRALRVATPFPSSAHYKEPLRRSSF